MAWVVSFLEVRLTDVQMASHQFAVEPPSAMMAEQAV